MDYGHKVLLTKFAGGFMAGHPVYDKFSGRPARVVATKDIPSPDMVPVNFDEDCRNIEESYVKFDRLQHREDRDFIVERVRFADDFQKGDLVIWRRKKYIVQGATSGVLEDYIPIRRKIWGGDVFTVHCRKLTKVS
ncbi:MAG: hypothetical protein A2224_01270 [Candidatus Magasanikbacteria bacterium RIFOXYA2_FULL_40_20]|nr:MAG: hypothetical protein A2224_01270 [Candidatus Magasanikbacteria bacterium RIFOXYA2_FULL_40_20]